MRKLSNHLGNVLSVISDIKTPVASGTVVSYYESVVISSQDYSPFGVTLEGRSWSAGYRYGFQNQETDEEMWDGAINYKYRVEDPRLGRFFSVDPLLKQFPYNSNYAFSENSTIAFIELEGLEKLFFMENKETIDISGMSADEVKKEAENRGYHWEDDWIDSKAGNEFWTLNHGRDKMGNSTGTRINKYALVQSYSKPKAKAYFSEMERDFCEWLRSWDAALDDRDGYKYSPKIMLALVATIASGGTLAAVGTSMTARILAGIQIGLTANELTSGPSETDKAILNDILQDYEHGEEIFEGAKLALSVRDAAKGLANITVKLVDGTELSGVYDIINDVVSITQTTIDTSKKVEEKQKDKKKK